MLLNHFTTYLVLFLCLGSNFSMQVSAQEQAQHPWYNWFDQMISPVNTDIFDGLAYTEQHRMLTDKHKFFMTANFSTGSLVYKGQPYYNLQLKYDLFQDQLLLRYSNKPNIPTVIVAKKDVSKFTLGDHTFINLAFETNKKQQTSGYFELLLENDRLRLLKKHRKRILRKMNDRIRYYEFKAQDSYYVRYQGDYYQLKGVGTFAALFPEFKETLKRAEATHKSLQQQDKDLYLISVFEDLSLELTNQE